MLMSVCPLSLKWEVCQDCRQAIDMCDYMKCSSIGEMYTFYTGCISMGCTCTHYTQDVPAAIDMYTLHPGCTSWDRHVHFTPRMYQLG